MQRIEKIGFLAQINSSIPEKHVPEVTVTEIPSINGTTADFVKENPIRAEFLFHTDLSCSILLLFQRFEQHCRERQYCLFV